MTKEATKISDDVDSRDPVTVLSDPIKAHGRSLILPLVLLFEVVLWSVMSPDFFSWSNGINVMRAAAPMGILAIGMTFVILTAGIDLSVGSVVSFTALVVATFYSMGLPSLVLLVIALMVGMGAGAVNGIFVSRFRIPPLITTLGTLYIFKAAARLWNNGGPLPLKDPTITWLGAGYIGPIPVPVVIFIIVIGASYWVLNQTRFGRHVYGVGGSQHAARLSGIRISRVQMLVYVISGALAALVSLLYAGRLVTASPLTGEMLELEVVAAVVVGGASIFGGSGSVRDTTIGVFILVVLKNGLTLVGISGFWQTMAIGVTLLVAVLFSGGESERIPLLNAFKKAN